jgi:hypothetical protein
VLCSPASQGSLPLFGMEGLLASSGADGKGGEAREASSWSATAAGKAGRAGKAGETQRGRDEATCSAFSLLPARLGYVGGGRGGDGGRGRMRASARGAGRRRLPPLLAPLSLLEFSPRTGGTHASMTARTSRSARQHGLQAQRQAVCGIGDSRAGRATWRRRPSSTTAAIEWLSALTREMNSSSFSS